MPWGGEYATLTLDGASGLWAVERAPALQPQRLVPGLWYPCANGLLTASRLQGTQCDCTATVGAFADDAHPLEANGTGAGLVRWHELRREAFLEGGRVLGAGVARLEPFAGAAASSPGDATTLVMLWSRFMGLGADACPYRQGPCFPAFVHYPAQEPTLPLTGTGTTVPFAAAGDAWPSGLPLRCVSGWPAHYACPDGYAWVGPNTTAFLDDAAVFLPGERLDGQIACLSCLPGAAAQGGGLLGGPYSCRLCERGTFAPGIASAVCALCPSGTYAAHRGATACDPCPPNHYTAAGAMDAGQCSPCAPGTGSCVDCVEGQYQDRAAQFVCHDCPGGTYSDAANATGCTACPLGMYQPLPGMAGCYACPPYLYTPSAGDGLGATACVACHNGACPVARGGQCGQGCGLNYYFDIQAEGGGCVRCPVSPARHLLVFLCRRASDERRGVAAVGAVRRRGAARPGPRAARRVRQRAARPRAGHARAAAAADHAHARDRSAPRHAARPARARRALARIGAHAQHH